MSSVTRLIPQRQINLNPGRSKSDPSIFICPRSHSSIAGIRLTFWHASSGHPSAIASDDHPTGFAVDSGSCRARRESQMRASRERHHPPPPAVTRSVPVDPSHAPFPPHVYSRSRIIRDSNPKANLVLRIETAHRRQKTTTAAGSS